MIFPWLLILRFAQTQNACKIPECSATNGANLRTACWDLPESHKTKLI